MPLFSFNDKRMKLAKSSAFYFMILVGTSPFREVLDVLISFHSFKTERVVSMIIFFFTIMFRRFFVFWQYKSYWIISNYWINPFHKISVLIRKNFEVRNNISEKCIENFCNFSFIIYDFILFNQHCFWRINRLVWKKRFGRFQKRFIVSYLFFGQNTITFLLSLSQECKIVISLLIIISSVFLGFSLKDLLRSLIFVMTAFKSSRLIIGEWLFRTNFDLRGTCLSNILWQTSRNYSKEFSSKFCFDNSATSSFR